MLSSALLSMGVDPYLHDSIIVNIVAYAQSIRNLVSHMAAGMVFPLRARIRLVTMHVRNERVLIDLATRESMIENEGRGNGMIPTTEISIKALKTETILEGESCMICLGRVERWVGSDSHAMFSYLSWFMYNKVAKAEPCMPHLSL
ncbi:hypothetical protein CK203_044306 [Vitis vinifera]|uniref:Uncharacterized protein n=1 Tax=Vitis vinifera TaxID=29760 RepID=A0A438H8H0_VITVI|nr:hypothetical protein CK203_044306 [Vitis vinifera]